MSQRQSARHRTGPRALIQADRGRSDADREHALRDIVRRGQGLTRRIETFPKPAVTAPAGGVTSGLRRFLTRPR
ncbi:hypothetical protein AB0J63_13825 [Streptosporangium canum]|uniref:hypothetical protein n=1 Tax=Streptosporangium canum TaxID=324952 RepID=UPI00343F3A19